MAYHTFPCGCSFPVLRENGTALPDLDFNVDDIPENCPAVWELLARGMTKGIFQLETNLGKHWVKQLRPVAIEHLIGLSAALRPGTLESKDQHGRSMTQVYCMRKNGELDIESIHPAVDLILEATFHVLLYQEQSMRMSTDIAGFDLQQADSLRKAAAKKLPEEMAKIKDVFIEGAKKQGIISEDVAKELWSWIEKSQRYSFCRAHSAAYGITAYQAAFLKAHFPLAFYTGWLQNAHLEQDPKVEVQQIVNEAKLMDILVDVPDLRDLREVFNIKDGTIRCGLTNISGVGASSMDKLREVCRETQPDHWYDWYRFLVFDLCRLSHTVVINLISSGSLKFPLRRQRMLAEYKVWNSLTEKEQDWIRGHHFETLEDALDGVAKPKKEGGGAANRNRISAIRSQLELLQNPPTPLNDSPAWLSMTERKLLGVSLTCGPLEAQYFERATISCKQVIDRASDGGIIGVVINEVIERTTKRGKNPGQKMASLVVEDHTCELRDVVCFPDEWATLAPVLIEGTPVLLSGEVNKQGSFVIKGAQTHEQIHRGRKANARPGTELTF